MKKFIRIYSLFMLFLPVAVVLQSCDNDDDNDEASNPEFIADDNTFSDFMSWELAAAHQGPDPSLGPAHSGNDTTVLREVYFKDSQEPQNGIYPLGTVIVKHSHNADQSVNEFTAMTKRGNGFASVSGDWEWFVLNSDGSIATDNEGNVLRGANLMGGMCVSCHAQASDKDYVFSK